MEQLERLDSIECDQTNAKSSAKFTPQICSFKRSPWYVLNNFENLAAFINNTISDWYSTSIASLNIKPFLVVEIWVKSGDWLNLDGGSEFV
jgi:hypothetical protein